MEPVSEIHLADGFHKFKLVKLFRFIKSEAMYFHVTHTLLKSGICCAVEGGLTAILVPNVLAEPTSNI